MRVRPTRSLAPSVRRRRPPDGPAGRLPLDACAWCPARRRWGHRGQMHRALRTSTRLVITNREPTTPPSR